MEFIEEKILEKNLENKMAEYSSVRSVSVSRCSDENQYVENPTWICRAYLSEEKLKEDKDALYEAYADLREDGYFPSLHANDSGTYWEWTA